MSRIYVTVTTVVMRWPRSACFDGYLQRWKDALKYGEVLEAMECHIEVRSDADNEVR
jgi:hypothetical protein